MFERNNLKLLVLASLVGGVVTGCGDEDTDGGNTADTGADVGGGDTTGTDTTGTDTTGTDTTGTDTTGEDTEEDTGPVVPCADDTDPTPSEIVSITANIEADTTWTADKIYNLTTLVFVTGATLTIEPGTTVVGENGAALVIATDGQINADGNECDPIVFTSSVAPGSRQPGDWGGVVLLGAAPINVGSNSIEGMEASTLSEYGGSDAAHDCGTIRYARIEFAGFTFGTDNELNSLTVGGCGSDTTIEYVQVHRGSDDGFEFFGGTASASHLVVTGTGDDSFDLDEGFSGSLSFIVAQQLEGAGDAGFEIDNLEDDNAAMPRTLPTISNFTLLSPGTNADQRGGVIRRGAGGTYVNGIVAGFDKGGFDLRNDVAPLVTDGDLSFEHILFFANAEAWSSDSEDNDNGFVEADAFTVGMKSEDPAIADWDDVTAPNFVPSAGSPAASGASAAGEAEFYGAFEPGAEAWTARWTAFPEN
jgi:hypothetical protein